MSTICCWKALTDEMMRGLVAASKDVTNPHICPIWDEKDCPFHGEKKNDI